MGKSAPASKRAPVSSSSDSSSDSDSSSSDSEVQQKKPVQNQQKGKTAPAPSKKAADSSSSDSDSSSDSESPAPAKGKAASTTRQSPRLAAKTAPKKASSDSDSSDSDSDSDSSAPAPAKKSNGKPSPAQKAAPAPAKKAAPAAADSSDSDSDSSSMSDEAPKKKAPAAASSSDSDSSSESDAPKAAPQKRKAEEAPASYNKKSRSDENGEEELKTVFCGGLSFDADENDLREFFSGCGEIVSVRIPVFEDSGKKRGIAFVEFADSESANKALEKDGQEIRGRWLKLSLSSSKPGNDKPRNQELSAKPDGCVTVFVGNLSFQATEDDLREAFSDCGNVVGVRLAMDRDTGRAKGFGHIEFDSTEATDAAVKMTGTMVAGRAIRVDYGGQRSGGSAGKFQSPRGRGGFGGGFGRGGGRGGPRGGRGGGFTPRGGSRGGFASAPQGKKVSFD